MTIENSCSTFSLTSTTTSAVLNYPQRDGLDKDLKKDIILTDFWSGDFWVRDDGLRDEPLKLTGYQFTTSDELYACFPWCFPLCFCDTEWYSEFINIDDMMDLNEEVTVAGLGVPFDAVYVIKNWSYGSTGTPLVFEWSLTLEKVRESD